MEKKKEVAKFIKEIIINYNNKSVIKRHHIEMRSACMIIQQSYLHITTDTTITIINTTSLLLLQQ